MPGRTLATWYGSGSDPSDNNTYPSLESSFYSRPQQQPGSSQYEQQQQYGYYPLTQGNTGNSYSEHQQRTFPSSYSQQQPPHFTPHSPASPASSGGNYHYNTHLTSPSGGSVSATPQHGMNYSNPQQQALYSSALSPGHYGSPNHGQHSGYSPSNSNSSGGNSQQWQNQQTAGDYSQHHSSHSPQHTSGLTGSPTASAATTPSPSPAHTPTPTSSLHSPPPSLAMSGQYPAHHHGRHPPLGSPTQSSQGHNLSSWGHHGAGPNQGMNLHSGAVMSGPPSQGPEYFLSPHHSLVGSSRLQGPPQHAHMSSTVPNPGDRRSPLHTSGPSSWNNLSSVTSTAKSSGSHDGNGRGPPPSSHPQQNNSGSSGVGVGGNPLFSLQMLVNQEINRNASASSGTAVQGNSYRPSTPSSHQQETVDLSSGSGTETYQRMSAQQAGPIPLTRTEKQIVPQVSEHLSVRNGSIIATTPSVVSNTNITSPPTPLNGEVSSDSGISSSAVPTPSSLPEIPSSSVTPNTDINKTKTILPVIDSKLSKETVSVIAQTPPREKSRISHGSDMSPHPESSEGKFDKDTVGVEPSSEKGEDLGSEKVLSIQEEKIVKLVPEENVERDNPVIMSSTIDSVLSRESTSNIVSSSSSGSISVSKQSDDGLSIPSPSPGPKDCTSPVRSPKSGNLKRTKKVDSILENLVESGTKKLSGNASIVVVEQPSQTPNAASVVVAPASVIVSPAITNEDSSSGLGRDMQTPSPGDQKQNAINQHKSPITVREEDAVSPTSGGGDDSESGKPRRKRKLDKPVRVSKISGEGENEKESTVEGGDSSVKEETQKLEEEPMTDECNETKEKSVTECPSSTTNQEEPSKSIEAVTLETVGSQDSVDKKETRRRRSSESSATSPPLSGLPESGQRTRRKSASDQQEENGSSNGSDLLSVLVSEQNDKNSMSDSKPEVKNAFIEVETELEKMFAGIVETEECVDPLKLDTASPVPMEISPSTKTLDSLSNIDSTSTEQKPSSVLKSRGRPKGSRNGTRRSSESIFGPSSTESTPKKKKKKQAKRFADDSPSSSQMQKKAKRTKLFQGENGNDSPLPRKKGLIKGESSRDGPFQTMSLYDSNSNTSSTRSRGPVIHIEGPRDNPYNVSVINAPSRGEDEDGGDRGGSKKQSNTVARRKNTSYHNDLNYRGKGGGGSSSGMFSSTLSARYDAHTTDRTWICVFCKNGPHCCVGGGGTSGDLFGPYLLSPPDKLETNGDDGSADERDITEEQKRSGGRNKRSLRGAHMVEQFCQKMSRKIQRSHSQDSIPVLGMVPVSSNGTDGKEDGCYEVWVHEECAVWAAGVHVVGSRIVGLREAVWSAVHTICSKCGEGGANVGCVRRGCEWRLHYGCAREQGWELDEDAYIARCAQHKKGVYSSEEAILPT